MSKEETENLENTDKDQGILDGDDETRDQETDNQDEKPSEDQSTDETKNNDEENTDEDGGLFDDAEDEYEDILGKDYDIEKLENYKKKYADEEGNFDSKKLLKALDNANKLASQKAPQAPEEYDFEKSEDLDFEFDENILESFKQVAKDNNLTNDQFNKIVNNFGEKTKEMFEGAYEEQRKEMQKEIKEIENFNERRVKMKRFIDNNLDEKQAKILSNSIPNKEMFEVVETLMNKASKNKLLNQEDRKPVDNKSKLEELNNKLYKEQPGSSEYLRLFEEKLKLINQG